MRALPPTEKKMIVEQRCVTQNRGKNQLTLSRQEEEEDISLIFNLYYTAIQQVRKDCAKRDDSDVSER